MFSGTQVEKQNRSKATTLMRLLWGHLSVASQNNSGGSCPSRVGGDVGGGGSLESRGSLVGSGVGSGVGAGVGSRVGAGVGALRLAAVAGASSAIRRELSCCSLPSLP